MTDGALRDALKAKALAMAEVARLRRENTRLRAADQIIRDLMQDNHWRTPRNDIYPRMIAYLREDD